MYTPITLPGTEKCPICQRPPHVLIYPGITVIKCKPMFQNTHLRVSTHVGGSDKSTDVAIAKWNNRVAAMTTNRERKNGYEKDKSEVPYR